MSTAPPTDTIPERPPEEPPARPAGRRMIYPRVFLPAAGVILAFVIFAIAATDTSETWLESARDWINEYLGWYYVVIVTGFIIFALVVGLSHFGNIKLGRDDEKPEFSMGAWTAMLFSAGMGIGLVFWGAAEPLTFTFADSRPAWGGTGAEVAPQAMQQAFLHWGLHAWGIYVVVGLAIAYAVHRKGRPVSIRWALEPVLGKYVKGWLGDLVDIIAIVGTLFGVATSLGLGVLQIGAGIEWLGWADDPGNFVYSMLIIAITLVATLSVVTGIKRGIKWLSQINVVMAGLLLLFVLIAGSTLVLLQDFVQNTGSYLWNVVRMSFDVGAGEGEAGRTWAGGWTVFYWGWWMSWAAFVGIFIARISRGRTVRQFVAGVLLIPTAVSFLWFTVMGSSAINAELDGAGLVGTDEDGNPEVTQEGALFGLLDTLPASGFIIFGTVILIALFFITSSDSGSFVVDMLASGGDPDPPTWSRVFWALLEGALAIALLLAGGMGALQAASITAAVGVSIVMILMCIAIWKQFQAEREVMLQVQRRQQAQELTDTVTQAMMDEGLIEANGGDKARAAAAAGEATGVKPAPTTDQ